MNQPDLFAKAPMPTWRPHPEKVRNRLHRILDEARAAETLPWDSSQVSLYRTVITDMTRWLPASEAARWRSAFIDELSRFGIDDFVRAEIG